MRKSGHAIIPCYALIGMFLLSPLSIRGQEYDHSLLKDGVLSAKLGGERWSSHYATARIVNGVLMVSGRNGMTISFLIPGKNGRYEIGNTASLHQPENSFSLTPADVALDNPVYTSFYDETTAGVIEVTTIDEKNKTVSGKFFCRVTRFIPMPQSIDITDGSFTKIPYTTNPEQKVDNVVSVHVDQSDFGVRSAEATAGLGKLVLNFRSEESAISLVIPQRVNAGNYELGKIDGEYWGFFTTHKHASYIAVNGDVTILEHNTDEHKIIGTFNFRGKEKSRRKKMVHVTDGAFTMYY